MTKLLTLLLLPYYVAAFIAHHHHQQQQKWRTTTTTATRIRVVVVLQQQQQQQQQQQDEIILYIQQELEKKMKQKDFDQKTILTTRMTNLNLHRTRLAPSTLPQAGRGLFATKLIAEGEIITCYPGDALFCDDDDATTNNNDNEINDDDDDDNYGKNVARWIDHVRTLKPIWGDHVDPNLRTDNIHENLLNDTTMMLLPPISTSYAVSVDQVHTLIGLPSLDQDPAYYGHFVNDAAGHWIINLDTTTNHLKSKEEETNTAKDDIEESISEYIYESLGASNAVQRPIFGSSNDDDEDKVLHMVTVASRDIAKGEEIFMTYGPDYWMAHNMN
mmetsp:Transcript_22894/g.33794  ORF Transcript_22894/g.33794 Transcript_22894/m.33794 type:complete len:330 (-) Transcript_22894:145-1134(-)